MSFEHEHQKTSSNTVVIVVTVVAVLLLGGLLTVAAAGFFFFRMSAVKRVQVMEQVAVAEEARARESAEKARLEAEMQRSLAEEQRARAQAAMARERSEGTPSGQIAMDPFAPDARALTFSLDLHGQLSSAGKQVPLDKLKELLEKADAEIDAPLEVILEAAPECPFRYVAEVQSVCLAAGVTKMRLQVKPEPK